MKGSEFSEPMSDIKEKGLNAASMGGTFHAHLSPSSPHYVGWAIGAFFSLEIVALTH